MKTTFRYPSIVLTPCFFAVLVLTTPCTFAQVEPIIDMHLHALHANDLGPPPLALCAPFQVWPVKDTHEDAAAYYARVQVTPACDAPLRSPATDDELMRRTLDILRARNVVAVTSGDLDMVEKWKQAGGDHILPATPFDPESGKPTVDDLRQLVRGKRIFAFAEVRKRRMGLLYRSTLPPCRNRAFSSETRMSQLRAWSHWYELPRRSTESPR